MKIGILSMQKINNYGSFLQALALKKEFEKRGHDVYFVDIEIGKQIVAPILVKRNLLSKFDKYIIKRIENMFLDRKMLKIYEENRKVFLDIEKRISDGEEYDIVVIGSDEVFNATVPSKWGFSRQLFGDITNAKKVVTYAASCGSTTYESVCHYGIEEEISECLNNVSSISVRDKNTFDFVKKISGIETEINVDPVFLGNYDDLIVLPKRRPYMLVYAYGNRINDEREVKAIKEYAKKYDLEIICVGMQQRWCSHNIAADAFELLGYVKNAECIVTDTFHGTVFSIKYNKRFVTLIRESNKNKLGGLLKQFSLYNRHVDKIDDFETTMREDIDYGPINQLIAEEQRRSSDYLDRVCLTE